MILEGRNIFSKIPWLQSELTGVFLIHLFTKRHKVVHNGGSPNFKGLLFDKKTNYLAQILQSLSYKVCTIILPKFNTFGLFIPILGTSAIMDQTAVVTIM